MPRDFDQIMRSRETDSWKRQWHGSIGTVVGGTLTVSVTPITGRDIQFITGLSFSSNLANCEVHLLNGTAFLYSMQLPSADRINETFDTPLKTSEGTALNIKLYNMWGTAFINAQGYLVK